MRRQNEQSDMLQMALAAQALGIGKQQAPGLDPNKVLTLSQPEQPSDMTMLALLNQYKDNPEVMNRLVPQLQLPPAQAAGGPPTGDALMNMISQSGATPKERRAVMSEKQGPGEAVIDENGNIIGFAKPGTQEMMPDYVPTAESVGGWPAFKYQTADFFKNLFNFNKPQFQGPALPVK
jgi:hypothetical protein